jgi:hypothetical protein
MTWVKRLFSFEDETMQNKMKQWEIVFKAKYIILPRPPVYRPIERWDKWGKMQANVISGFYEHWEIAHTYFWVQTYVPKSLTEVLAKGNYEELTPYNKDERIFVFPDCQDQNDWATILSIMALGSSSRCIYILNENPHNWLDAIISLHGITREISEEFPVSNFTNNIKDCHCLCGSADEDLVIYKIDLEEKIVLSVLEKVAKEEGLELVIRRGE